MKHLLVLIVFLGIQGIALGQNLSNGTIFKIGSSKKAIYHSTGTFHNGGIKGKSTLKGVRHSYSGAQGYERIVFDFTTNQPPKIYGHLSPEGKKIYIDFFDTELRPFGENTYGNTKYVDKFWLFPFSGDSLAVEMLLDTSVSADIFTLSSPGRLVIDIKKN